MIIVNNLAVKRSHFGLWAARFTNRHWHGYGVYISIYKQFPTEGTGKLWDYQPYKVANLH